jgi:hypothetical protein
MARGDDDLQDAAEGVVEAGGRGLETGRAVAVEAELEAGVGDGLVETLDGVRPQLAAGVLAQQGAQGLADGDRPLALLVRQRGARGQEAASREPAARRARRGQLVAAGSRLRRFFSRLLIGSPCHDWAQSHKLGRFDLRFGRNAHVLDRKGRDPEIRSHELSCEGRDIRI